MSAAKAIEIQIIRHLLRRQQAGLARQDGAPADLRLWLERLIVLLASTAGLFLLGSYSTVLLWALLGGATLVTLR